jgi:hypothetical protein
MNLYFFGDTDQRVYTLNNAQFEPTYSYSGAFQIFGNGAFYPDTIYPKYEDFIVGEHDKRFNLRFYNSFAQIEKDVEIVQESDSAKKHRVYRLNEKELLKLPKSQEFQMNYKVNNDKKIVVIWTEEKVYKGLPPRADCYIWVVEKQLPDPDFFKSLQGDKVIIVKGDILRSNGSSISRSLSWEKTATETVWQITQNRLLRDNLMYAQIVFIPFGLEGAVLIDRSKKSRTEKWENNLWFSPSYMEGDIQKNHPGYVPEAFEALVYGLIQNIESGLNKDMALLESISYNIEKHLEVAIRVHICGYRLTTESSLNLNYDYVIDSSNESQPNTPNFKFYSENIPDHERNWSIAFRAVNKDLSQSEKYDVLSGIIKNGPEIAIECPMLKIGNLITIDRSEIESYSNIRNLLRDYITKKNPGKPLSLAVFGQPGSGKSFGVKEIAKNLLREQAKFLEYNLSQFSETSMSALLTVFHDIQDETLNGNLPLVFFDEFDSSELDWLKYFLMPMEDGCFVENGTQHPLGKCIFIFAGGTNHTFKQLAKKCDGIEKEKYVAKKLTDFLSRLKGYIDILGINQLDQSNQLDQNVLFRRAVILSNMIKQMKYDLSEDVLNALLYTKEYKHGVRSMKAIIEMSRLSINKQLKLSDLPPHEQLKLHVDPWDFESKLENRISWEECHGRIARFLLWNDKQIYWENCYTDEQTKYWEKAEKIIEIIVVAFGLNIGLCGDTYKVSDDDRGKTICQSSINDSIINIYSKKLHEYLHKHKTGQSDVWHKCVDIEWSNLDEEAIVWLKNNTKLAFAPFLEINTDNTPYYLAGTLDDGRRPSR